MSDCVFCKIVSGVIDSQCVYQDDFVFAFRDIAPQAPVHVLVIPRVHIESVSDVVSENSVYVAKCFEAISKIAVSEGLDSGFRVIANTGSDGAQTVFHLHFHLLGGRPLGHKLVRDAHER